MAFKDTRKKLYYLFVAINLVVLWFIVAVMILGDAVEPIWQWPVEIARVFMPGLFENLVSVGMRFPMRSIVLAAVILTMYWINRLVKVEEQEWAFQGWGPVQGAAFSPGPMPKAANKIAMLSRFFPVIYVPVFVLTILCGLVLIIWLKWAVLICLFTNPSCMASAEPGMKNGILEKPACCADVSGPRRIGVGETVEVQILANRKRNETGLLLLKGEIYTAKYVSHEKWKDGKYSAKPTGVEFDGFVRFFAKSVAWLRPYPEGKWFQIVGRIDRGHYVFPVLDATDPKKPYQFIAPDDGELVLLVNDVLYRNNSGVMTISIHRPREYSQSPGRLDSRER